MDDILAHTEGWKEHIKTLREFFERVRKTHLTLKPKKCSIGYGKIDFLGHTIKGDNISPQVESIDRIVDMPRPQSKKQVRSFLGAVNYYRKVMPHCAELMAPLSDLTRRQSSNTVNWTSENSYYFHKVEDKLQVCQRFHLSILNISNRLISCYCDHNLSNTFGVPVQMKHGKHKKRIGEMECPTVS